MLGVSRLRYQCQQTIYLYLRKNFPWINCSRDWPDILKTLQNYRPRLHCYHVVWKVPEDRWIKYNTDGACRGNPGQSSYAFCIRDSRGDLNYAEVEVLGVLTNIEAETKVVLHWLRYSYKLEGTRSLFRQIPWCYKELY